MEAKEFRIGNIIKQGQITDLELGYNEIIYIAVNHGYGVSDPEPEILTEEWLLKFGFMVNREFNFENYPFEIQKSKFDSECFLFYMKGSYVVRIKYVHQLQNLYFALTGKELEPINNN